MVVPVKAIRERLVLLYETWNAGAIGEKDIQKTIVVEIQESHSPKDRVDNRFVVGRAVIQDKLHARFWLPVFETDLAFDRSLRPGI
jgi:hypothetical protein